MLFSKTKELKKVEENQPLNKLGDVQGSIIMIVENLLDNVNYYTNTIERLEKENKELRQFCRPRRFFNAYGGLSNKQEHTKKLKLVNFFVDTC